MGEDAAAATFRVLGVQSSMADNGGLRVFLQLLHRWGAAGASPVLFVVKRYEGGATPELPPGLDVRHGATAVRRSRYEAPRTLARLARLARTSDIVVSGSEIGLSLLFGYLAARLVRRPFVVIVHADLDDAIATWTPGPLRRLTRSVNARADAVVCVEGGLVDSVLRNGARPSAVRVVTNGIDVHDVRRRAGLTPDGVESAADLRGGVPVVVGNGRLAPQKGFDLLVEAHAKVVAAGFPHRLLITGEGPDRPALEALVRRLGVESSVDLPGFSPNPYPAMASADVFVLSSRSEGLPLTLLEAMAVGAPIIATECGSGPRRLLGDSEVGQLVPSDSADALAQALVAHFQDTATLGERARGGPVRAREFDIGRAAAEHLEVLKAVALRS